MDNLIAQSSRTLSFFLKMSFLLILSRLDLVYDILESFPSLIVLRFGRESDFFEASTNVSDLRPNALPIWFTPPNTIHIRFKSFNFPNQYRSFTRHLFALMSLSL